MDTQKIGLFIKEQRAAVGLTQKELAEKLGCTDKAVSRWETGRGMPDISFIMPLSDVLGVSVAELIAGEKYIEKAANSAFEERKSFCETKDEVLPFEEQKSRFNTDSFSDRYSDIIRKSNETLVDVIADSEKKIRWLNRSSVLTVLMCCLQVFIFFAMPQILSDSAPLIDFMIVLTAINSALLGLFGNRTKWIFPLFVFLLLAFANVLNTNSSEGWILTYIGFLFAVGSLGVVGVFSLIKRIPSFKKLKKYNP
ncbi:MAG: helix-turn-helix domain-containing protein [Clostridia bacterium]|nr:helix-turn-helix domain-containing protein [Clostridia bacterium]